MEHNTKETGRKSRHKNLYKWREFFWRERAKGFENKGQIKRRKKDDFWKYFCESELD